MTQQACAHAGGGGVEYRQQGRRRFAAQGFGEFQVASGSGVELDEITVAFGLDRLNMRQRGALRVLDIVEQGACGSQGLGQVGHAKSA